MSIADKFGFLSFLQAARQLQVSSNELRAMIKSNILPPPMRDLGGKRKYYNSADLVEMQLAIEKFKTQK